MARVVAILGEYALHGDELRFLRDRIRGAGCDTRTIDLEVGSGAALPADVGVGEVVGAAGAELSELLESGDRAACSAALAAGAVNLIQQHFRDGTVHAVVGLGGFELSTIAIGVMRGLPVGVPKLMICTHTSGGTARFAGTRDVLITTSGLHVADLDRLSCEVLANAAAAVAAMALRPAVHLPSEALSAD